MGLDLLGWGPWWVHVQEATPAAAGLPSTAAIVRLDCWLVSRSRPSWMQWIVAVVVRVPLSLRQLRESHRRIGWSRMFLDWMPAFCMIQSAISPIRRVFDIFIVITPQHCTHFTQFTHFTRFTQSTHSTHSTHFTHFTHSTHITHITPYRVRTRTVYV